MRLRLRLRLHPGRGFACLPELWARWGRFASFRESRRTRPGLPWWFRALHPSSHAVCLGRAHYRHRLWQTIQENILIVGRSRSGKSGWLAKVIIHFRGPVVSATTKTDLFTRTSGLRARFGRPVHRFNPEGLGGALMRDNDVVRPGAGLPGRGRGHAPRHRADRRGADQGHRGDGFWSEQAAVIMPALLCAAALARLTLRDVFRWVLTDTREAERILRAHQRQDWAAVVAQTLRGPADKTGATITMVLRAALKFMNNPRTAECVLPAPDGAFDIGEFLRRQGTLYLIADQRNETSPVAPLFACLVAEIHYTACQMAAESPGERLDPPLLLQLDEVTRICPIPVPALLADSGGRGIMMILAAQGLAQIEDRWGKPATRSVLDTSNQLYVSGVQDPETLRMVSDLCDTVTYRVRGKKEETEERPAATPAMIRRLPKRRALVMRGDTAPVITHLPMGWHDWRYRWARLRGRHIAQLAPLATAARRPETLTFEPFTVPAPGSAAPAGARPRWPLTATGTATATGTPAVAAHPWDQR